MSCSQHGTTPGTVSDPGPSVLRGDRDAGLGLYREPNVWMRHR
ncbi:hypothetical protein [Streptomyces sp. 351MFTsu5.1]|nr:hypothetical protein [Streptomyces sp. 351MFTsu5.1]